MFSTVFHVARCSGHDVFCWCVLVDAFAVERGLLMTRTCSEGAMLSGGVPCGNALAAVTF